MLTGAEAAARSGPIRPLIPTTAGATLHRALERFGYTARRAEQARARFGLLLESFDSYAVAWAVFAALSGLVTAVSLFAGPAIDRESR